MRHPVGTTAARLAILAITILAAGCLAPMADPGPNPATLGLRLRAAVSPDQVQAKVAQAVFQPLGRVRFDSTLGPEWQLEAHLLLPDGKLQRLPAARGREFQGASANQVDATVAFLAPPGPAKLSFVLEAVVNRSWEEQLGGSVPVRNARGEIDYQEPEWRTRSDRISVARFEKTWRGELRPGQTLDLGVLP